MDVPLLPNRTKTTESRELKKILQAFFPLLVTLSLQYSLSVVSVFSVGHLGPEELAAASLAAMTVNISAALFSGIATSLDTLCSQAFGARNYTLVGVYFQKSLAMTFCINVPIVCIWWHAAYFLGFIVVEPRLALLAQSYLRVMVFATPGYIAFENGKRFLQSQGIFKAGQFALFMAAPVNCILNYFLVWRWLGFIGAPIATATAYWVMAVSQWIYAFCLSPREQREKLVQCMPHFNLREAFSGWGMMLTFVYNGVIMILAEHFAFEAMTLASARFGVTALAAQSIIANLASLSFQLPFAAAVCTSTRVGNYIGAVDVTSAKIAMGVGFRLSFGTAIANLLLLVPARHILASLFTNDPDVEALAARVVIVLAVNGMADSLNMMASGLLRAQARQYIGGRLNLIAYYLVALPVAYYLAFVRKLEVVGLWIGLGSGIFFLVVMQFYFLFAANWDDVERRAKELTDRARSNESPAAEV